MAEFNHSNNLFFNLDSSIIVFSDNPAENKEYAEGAIITNPLLVNLFKGDYRLKPKYVGGVTDRPELAPFVTPASTEGETLSMESHNDDPYW